MKKFFTHENRMIVFHVKNLLENAGIEYQLRNEFSAGATGDLAPFDTWPELWVESEEDLNKANQILVIRNDGKDKLCFHCGEENPFTFDVCWNCTSQLREN